LSLGPLASPPTPEKIDDSKRELRKSAGEMAEEQVDYEAYEEEQPMADGAGEDVSGSLCLRETLEEKRRRGEVQHRRLPPSGARCSSRGRRRARPRAPEDGRASGAEPP